MIPYLRIKGENSITCNCDLVILNDSEPILISLVDYAIKTKKVSADFINQKYHSITLEDREDNTLNIDLRMWNNSFNFKSDRAGELTHTIIKNKNINNYIIDWNNDGEIKSIVNYIRNVHYIPVTSEIVENIINAKNYICKDINVYTNNPEFKDLKAYYINMHSFKENLESLSIQNNNNDSFNWDDIETIEDYLFTFLEPIKNKINETVKVLYNPNNVNKGIFEGKKKPFDGQIPIIQGGIEVLKQDDFIYIGADMGVGKTLIGAKVNHNYFKEKNKTNYTTLIVTPAITLTQWKDELKDSIGDKVNIVLVKKTEDFIKWYNNKDDNNRPTYILIGKETFKLSYAKEPCFKKVNRYMEVKEMDEWYKTHAYYSKRDYMYSTRKKLKEVLVCPDCGVPLKNTNRTSEDVFFKEKDFKTINKGNYKCHSCNSVLWAATYNKTKKTSVIDFIHRKGIIFDSVIVDEAHESNNSGSIIGNSTRTLIREHSKKVIALSGTSNNGYASSLHNLLMAVCPNKLKSDECLDVKDFIQKYGTLQAVTDITNEEKRYYYRRGKSEIKDSEFKEIEGINPIVFTKYLAENSIFATLDDLGKDLPEIKEMYIPITPDNEQVWGANRLYNDIKEVNAFNSKMYVDSIIKHYINNPNEWKPIPIQGNDKEKEVQPKNLDIDLLPKDEELIRIVKQEIKENRKVWIYTEFNNGGEYMKGEKIPNRLERLLKAEGIRVFQLRASTSTYERKEIIEANKDKYDVFISNPRLVNVGINLVFCPSYIFYMPSYQVNIVSQASRRGYRANSILENRIYHLYYKDTWEDNIIKRYQRKLAESKAINGQFDVALENDSSIRTASKLSVNINKNI